jgi:hypothetical protein
MKHPKSSRREVLFSAAVGAEFFALATAEVSGEGVRSKREFGAASIPVVSTRAALAAYSTSAQIVLLQEDGREGFFRYAAEDLSVAVASDRAQGIHVPPDTERSGRAGAWVRLRDQNIVLASWFGALPGGDRTPELQAAFDYITRGEREAPEKLVIGDVSSRTIRIPRENGASKVQVEIQGTWTNLDDNSAHILIEGAYVWGWEITGRGHVTWSTPGHPVRGAERCFLRVAEKSVFYNGRIEGVQFSRGHYLVDASGEFWGVSLVHLPSVVPTGGLIRASHPSGKPSVIYQSVYLDCQDAIGPIFDTTSLNASYIEIELNRLMLGPTILRDLAGGRHNIVSMSIELGTYGRSGATLFNVLNSDLSINQIYLDKITFDEDTRAFHTSGAAAIQIGRLYMRDNVVRGRGALVLCWQGNILIDRIRIDGGANFGAGVLLTDIVNTDAAETIRVRSWAEPRSPRLIRDGTYAVRYDDAPELIVQSRRSEVTVQLPPIDNLWSGRSWTVRRLGPTGTLIIRSSNNDQELARLDAGSGGSIRATFIRAAMGGAERGWLMEKGG